MENNKQSNNSSNKSNEVEIDLGQLFSFFGKGFSNVYNFFINSIRQLIRSIFIVIFFIRRHLMKLVLGTIVGSVGGNLYKINFTTPTYESSMTVQPNFGSTMQLYKNVDFYQNLVSQKDSIRLASSLNISTEEAAKITKIEAIPYANANQSLLAYQSFASSLDSSLMIDKVDLDDFIDNLPVESYQYHIINIQSKDKYIFGKLRSPIISSIIRNPYYDQVRETSYLNLLSAKSAINNSMQELDTLRDFYKDIMIKESEKVSTGTNIFMSSTKDNNKEIVVFDKYMKMNELMRSVNKKLIEKNDVITVISSFIPVGNVVTGWRKEYTLLGGLLGFILVFFIYGSIKINHKLNNYEKYMNA